MTCSDLDLKSATNLTSIIPHRFEDTRRYHVKKRVRHLPIHPGDIIVYTGTVRYSEGGGIFACGIQLCAGAALRGHARASVSGSAIEVAEPLAMFDIFAVVFIAIPRTFASASQNSFEWPWTSFSFLLLFLASSNRPVLKHLEDHPQYLP